MNINDLNEKRPVVRVVTWKKTSSEGGNMKKDQLWGW